MAPNGQETEGVKLTLGGKERTLRFDYNTICALEQAEGTVIYTDTWFRKLTPRKWRSLLWACLVTQEPALTLEEVGQMMGFDQFAYLGQKIGELVKQIELALEVIGRPTTGQPPASGAGTTSGPSAGST